MTVSSEVIEPFLSWSPDAVDVPLLNGLRIQILPTIEDLYRARRYQYAAFIASDRQLVVWDDDPTHLLTRAKAIETELLQVVWQTTDDLIAEKDLAMSTTESDPEAGPSTGEVFKRPVLLYNSFMVACSVCLLTVLIGLGYTELVQEVIEIRKWVSLTFLIMTPVNIFLTLVGVILIWV
jgi:hypothetical protein